MRWMHYIELQERKPQFMDKNNILEKEIDLIQNCISRMSQNSFNVKGWFIGLIIAVIALLPESIDASYVCLIILITTFIFWGLDAFYLKMEKLYRWKYEWVIVTRLTTTEYSYNLNPYEQGMWLPNKAKSLKKEPCLVRIMFTKTLIQFYLPIIIIALIVLFREPLTQLLCKIC